MSSYSHDASLPARPPTSAVPAAHRRELSAEELATLPLQALLVRSGRLSIDQLSEALRENVSTGRAVEDIAVSRGWLPMEELEELRRAKAAHAPHDAVVPAPAPPPVAPPPAPAPQVVEPVAVVQPPPPPPVAPPAPAPAPVPVAVAPAPAFPPAPAPEPARTPPPIVQTNGNSALTGSVGVFLTLTDGERIWVGRFASPEDGERRAHEVIEALMRPEPGVWPRFGNRLVRPESVVAVEVSKRRDD